MYNSVVKIWFKGFDILAYTMNSKEKPSELEAQYGKALVSGTALFLHGYVNGGEVRMLIPHEQLVKSVVLITPISEEDGTD